MSTHLHNQSKSQSNSQSKHQLKSGAKAELSNNTKKIIALVLVVVLFGFWLIENGRQKELEVKIANAEHQRIVKMVAAYQTQLFSNDDTRQQAFDMIGAATDATDIYLYSIDNPDTAYAWQNNARQNNISQQPKYRQEKDQVFNRYFFTLDDLDYSRGYIPVLSEFKKENFEFYIRYPYPYLANHISPSFFQHLAYFLLLLLPCITIYRARNVDAAKAFAGIDYQFDSLKQRMSSTQRMSKVGSWDFDIGSETLIWSEEVFDMFGLEYEPSNTGAAKFFDAIHPDDFQMLNEVFEQSLQSESGHYDVEHRIIDYKTGEVRYLHERCVHVADEFGQFTHSIGMVQDITERHLAKQAVIEQQKERDLVMDIMADGVITINEKGIVLTFNNSAEKLFGYQAEEVIGKNINCLMPPKYADHHDGYLLHFLDTGEERIINTGREVEGLRSDGCTFMLQLTVAELPQKPNQLRRFIGSCMDLTDIKQKEEMLWRSQKLDALGKISGGIAHDFNNMLGVILGYSQLLSNQLNGNEKLNRYAEQIVYASERGAALTSKLLAFSRRRPSVHHNVNMNQLIQTQTEVISKALTVNVSLVLDLAPDVWTTKLEDAAFDDMLLNLAINAMHAIEGHGHLTIATSNVSLNKVQGAELELSTGDYVCLTVADDGCGMDEQVKAQIFDPFFTTKGKEGTGFGLSQVYGFVRSAGGVIDVQSTLGEGSCFSLYFPRKLIRIGEAVVDDSKAQLFINGDESILVVDDEPSLCMLAVNIIEKYGYQVHAVTSAHEALTYLTKNKVDLVLSDIIMPKMNGYQLVTDVRCKYVDIRCLLVSGFIGQQEQIDERQCADIKVMTKPYTTHSLMRAIRIELNSRLFEQCDWHNISPWQNHSSMTTEFNHFFDKLLTLVGRLKSSNKPNKVELTAQFIELGQDLARHFAFEEAQMGKWDYPYINEHIKAHKHFAGQFDIDIDNMEIEQLSLFLEQFLKHWTVEHVMLMDKAVAPFICDD